MRINKFGMNAIQYILLIAYLAFLVFPLAWMFSTSIKPTPEIYSATPTLLPRQPTGAHYLSAFTEDRIGRSILNSLQVGLLATAAVIALALPAAYALARYRTALNKAALGWILASQIFPAILIMAPLYLVLRNLRLTDSLFGLAVVYVVWSLPFVLWMLEGYVRGVPVELEEAAAMDGASRLQIIFRVLMPVLLPAVGASALFAFISAWNEFFFALVLLKNQSLITLPVDLARFTGMEGQARTGPLAAASFVATIPSLALFGFLQKWFSSGLTSGALKN